MRYQRVDGGAGATLDQDRAGEAPHQVRRDHLRLILKVQINQIALAVDRRHRARLQGHIGSRTLPLVSHAMPRQRMTPGASAIDFSRSQDTSGRLARPVTV